MPSKIGEDIKQAAAEAFDDLGGKRWLLRIATDHPVDFLRFIQKMIPAEQNSTVDHRHTLDLSSAMAEAAARIQSGQVIDANPLPPPAEPGPEAASLGVAEAPNPTPGIVVTGYPQAENVEKPQTDDRPKRARQRSRSFAPTRTPSGTGSR